VAHGATASGAYLWLRDYFSDRFGAGQAVYRLFVPNAPPGELLQAD
jgi:hypothetical protein